MKKQKKGFTVVELVIVIAVIAILAAVLIPTFTGLINNARKSKTEQLVRNMNTALSMDVGSDHSTAHSAFTAAKKRGYDVELINESKTDNPILYDSLNKLFCYWDEDAEDYYYVPDFEPKETAKPTDYFAITNSQNAENFKGHGWSVYAARDWKDDPNVSVTAISFDSGDADITSVTYNGGDSEQKIILRTNSADTTLKITDTTDSKIMQYGDCGILEAEVGMNSLYIEGHVNFVEAKAGHIVANGLVDAMFTSADSLDDVKVEGNVSHAHASTETGAAALNASTDANAVIWDYDGDNDTTNHHPDVEPGTTTASSMKDEVAPSAFSASLEVDESWACRIGETGYVSLKAAVDAAKNNDVIVVLKDFVIDSEIAINKSITLELDGYTISNNKTGSRPFMITDANVNVRSNKAGGGIMIPEDNTGSYGMFEIKAISKDIIINLENISLNGNTDDGALVRIHTVNENFKCSLNMININSETNNRVQTANTVFGEINLKIIGGNYSGDQRVFCVDSYTNASGIFKDVTAKTVWGPIVELDCGTTEFTNCNFKVIDEYEKTWYSVCIGVSYDAKAIINSGTYTSNKWSALAFYTNGSNTFIINGGTFTSGEGTASGKTNNHAICYDYSANNNDVFTVNGGTFNGEFVFKADTIFTDNR